MVFGGYHDSLLTNTIGIMNMDSGAWRVVTAIGDVPSPRAYHAAVSIGDSQMWVYGGLTVDGVVSSEVYILDIDSGVWSLIEIGGMSPGPRAYHTAHVYHNKYVVMFGGTDGCDLFNDVHVFNMETSEWARMPCPFTSSSTSAWKSRSSSSSSSSTVRNEDDDDDGDDNGPHAAEDEEEEEEEEQYGDDECPAPRSTHVSALLEEFLLVAGGKNQVTNTSFDDTWVLHIPSRMWVCVGLSGEQTDFPAGCTQHATLTVIGTTETKQGAEFELALIGGVDPNGIAKHDPHKLYIISAEAVFR